MFILSSIHFKKFDKKLKYINFSKIVDFHKTKSN